MQPPQQVLVQPKEEEHRHRQRLVRPVRPKKEEQQQPPQVLVRPKEEEQQQQLLRPKEEDLQPDMPVTTPAQSNSLKRALPISAGGSSTQRAKRTLKTPKREMDKCDYCDLEIAVEESQQLKHMWKKHKDQVYKFLKPELVCSAVPYCDYVATTVLARKIHEGRTHGKNPLDQEDVVPDFVRSGKCTYCDHSLNRIGYLKKHMLDCPTRDERPCLGCTSCPDEKFHFVYDFTAHLKANGGLTHGKPVML
ncbi:hypothetical protein PENTCL1PPCAC_4372 [Pristionchus entomophagus]|uniref:C2H2-type domain-containing protein n=1 Tax=Pristionchus entomophagus TaxID=358040 RepID=A0AAV5SFS0_9BILA|nr:hypothetical protein PENTCL1PPCAC_4372 [Pristionchus entomophagus]